MSSHQTNPSPWTGFNPDHHAIETPEQTVVSFDIAGIGSRFLALLVDSLIQGAAVIIALIAAGILGYTRALRGSPLTTAILVAGLIAFGFLLLYGYFILFEIFWNGQTPGKRAIGIRVIKDSGRRLTPIESMGRNLLRIVDQLPGLYAIGLLCAVLNRQNKRLGDLVAGSLVIREASLRDLKPVWQESFFSIATRCANGRRTFNA